MSVLEVGKIPQPLAEALAAKYETLQLPDDASRPAFLSQHGPSVTAIVEAGTSRVDADLMNARRSRLLLLKTIGGPGFTTAA